MSPRPEADDAIDDAAVFEPRVGAIAIGLFFVLFLGWAAFARLDAGAYASGQVAVSGNRQAVQHREGGVVGELRVAEGDAVRRGQLLIRLSAGELEATERGVAGQVFALLAHRARLTAERDGRALVAPPEFAGLPPADAALANASLALQRRQMGARREGRSTETGVLGQRVAQLNEQIVGYERQIAANAEQQRLIAEELEGIRALAARGYAPMTQVRALERSAAQLEGERGALQSQIARSREAVGEARLQMSGVSSKMNEDVAEQLRQIDVQLNELRPRLNELRAQLARTEIRAPADGEVVGLSVFTPGGVVAPGQTLMEVVPADASQVIVAQVSPNDIDGVRPGRETEIRFPGLRGAPSVRGQVTRVSADSFTVEQTGAAYYRVEIVVPPEQLATLGPAADRLGPGAPAEVVIVLRPRTALQYLIEPLTRSLWRSGSER
ncbi:HlyD family type I secretion periplasmic adaptor subunit [Brevundimonas kwangchunensis]|uniref:Membrane fusion protein (MFP) family protein n=1 Tax=Brevundimonas kwangchunensis TaxID=322163 RepID=A0ABN1H3M2_9CAUL